MDATITLTETELHNLVNYVDWNARAETTVALKGRRATARDWNSVAVWANILCDFYTVHGMRADQVEYLNGRVQTARKMRDMADAAAAARKAAKAA